MSNFTQRFIEYMLECRAIKNGRLFVDAAQAADGNTQLCTTTSDRSLDVELVDGSIERQIVFTLFDYRSVEFLQVAATMIDRDGNLENIVDVQSVIDWITDQNKAGNFPDFGTDCEVTKIESVYFVPSAPTIDKGEISPNIAKYSIPIRVYFTDYSEAI